MPRMTTPSGTAPQRQDGGERRLARPPSDRYGAAEPPAPADDDHEQARGSLGRAIAFGALTGLGLAAAITVLGGILLITAGLIAVAGLGGWAIAVAVRAGGLDALAPSRRRALAAGLAAVAVLAGQLGLWLFARYEGGVLEDPWREPDPAVGCAVLDKFYSEKYLTPAEDLDCCYTFGPIVEKNEHCNIFVYYYPKQDDVNCF